MKIMQSTKLQHFIQNYIWVFIHSVVTMVFPFLLRSLMIRKWGLEYVGINGLFASVLQVLNIAELGIGSAILYSMYKPMVECDINMVNALLNLYRRIYKLLGIGILVAGLLLLPFLEYLIQGNYPNDINIYIIYLIQLSNTVVGYITCAYWNVILQADQKIDIDYKIGIATTSIMYILQIVIICNCKNYYLYIIWLPLTSLALNIIRAMYVKRKYPLIHCEGKVEYSFIKDFYRRILAMAISKIRTAIRGSIDSIVISANLGLVILAQYQNYYQVMRIPILLVAMIKGAVIPSFGVSVATESKAENYHIFELYSFVDNWIATWGTACLLCLAQNFMCLWAGLENVLADRIVVLLCVYFYLYCISENALMIRETTGLWWIGKEGAVIESILNLALNIVFIKYWGVEGVLIATILTLLCVNLPFEFISIFKGYFLEKPYYYFVKQGIYAINAFVICAITRKVCGIFPIGSFNAMIAEIGICIFVPNLLYILLNFYQKEFKEVLQLLKDTLKEKGQVS